MDEDAQFVTTQDILDEIKTRYAVEPRYKTAERLGISPAYLSDILLRRRELSAGVGAKLGYKRIVLWEPIEGTADAPAEP